jgi:tRNA-dihydrouridine synthase
MSVQSHNATPPAPAIAPGSETIDPRRVAEAITARGMDPRITAAVPAFNAPFFQAGLAGYSDAAMRIIARRHGCPYCVTEALLDRVLLAGGRGFDKADLGELRDNIPGGAADQPLAGQIMGSEPAEMAAAALKMVEQRRRSDREYRELAYARAGSFEPPTPQHLHLPGGEQLGQLDPTEGLGDCEESCDPLDYLGSPAGPPGEPEATDTTRADASRHESSFQAIDVNLACPVKKIERKARGGHWLAEPLGAIRILEAVREAVPRDVACTVKLRRAFDDTPEMATNCERILKAAAAMGYAWATVHARTVQQKYVGPSRWDMLAGIVSRTPELPILGSGDIWDAADIFRMIAYTGVSGVAVARGCIGNPWIFRQARQLMAGLPPAPPSLAEQRDVLRAHFDLSLAVTRRFRHAEETTCRNMRKFAIKFAQHHPNADAVRRRFVQVETAEHWLRTLDECYPEKISPRVSAKSS